MRKQTILLVVLITSDGSGGHLLVLEVRPAQVPVLVVPVPVPVPAQVLWAVRPAQAPGVGEGAHERRQRMGRRQQRVR